MARHSRLRDAWPRHGRAARRAGNLAWARDQPVRRGTRAHHDLDRDIQWRVKNAVHHHPSPLLRKLDSIECRDALLAPDGKGGFVEAEWPEANFIVGNSPFLGGKLMRSGLGDKTVETLFNVYEGRVPAEADLVCYWFERAWEALQTKRAKRVGLVATNSIRGGANRRVLQPIAEAGAIFEAWSDESWIVEGAAVRVSLVCFGAHGEAASLNRISVPAIHADLTAEASNLVTALPQPETLASASWVTRRAAPSTSRDAWRAHGSPSRSIRTTVPTATFSRRG